jgi:tetratricopeptide (TPR) repeat protein
MQRITLAGCSILLLLAAVSASYAGPPPSTINTEDARVASLISQLADPDPLIRASAVQRLNNLGEAARPALRQALSTASPQAKCEIDQVLLHIPWVKPGDSDAVENALTGYADLEAEGRCARIDNWLAPLQNAASLVLLRVILNDPSSAVRWEAAGALRTDLDDNPAVARQLIGLVDGSIPSDQCYLPARQNAPLLAVAGWALRLSTPTRAADLLNQALQMEQDHPSAFLGQLDFVYMWLIDRATARHDHAMQVALLRQQADRTAWNDDRVPDAVTGLFATQADFGPSPEFQSDLRAYREYFSHPEMVYTLARLCEHQGYALPAEALNLTALLMSGNSADSHYMAGTFLALHNWISPAERELKWALALSDGKTPNIYFQLSALADARDDDLASAQYMEAGLQKLADSHGLVQTNRDGQVSPWNPDDGWAEVHWHYLRAARDAGDLPTAKLHLDKLLAMDADTHILDRDPGMAADIVPALQQQGRAEQADTIFEAAYKALTDKMHAEPDDPMQANNLAWLCACTGKHLDQALQLSAHAVAMSPDDAACLDTQAEAFMRSGQPQKAVEIEAHALEVKPDDVYMQKQITRFKTAAGSKVIK